MSHCISYLAYFQPPRDPISLSHTVKTLPNSARAIFPLQAYQRTSYLFGAPAWICLSVHKENRNVSHNALAIGLDGRGHVGEHEPHVCRWLDGGDEFEDNVSDPNSRYSDTCDPFWPVTAAAYHANENVDCAKTSASGLSEMRSGWLMGVFGTA